MLVATEAMRRGTALFNTAVLLHGVPYTTLKDHLSGRVVHGTKPWPIQYHKKEECALANH